MTTTTFAAFALALLALCTPALADTPPRGALRLRVTVHDGATVQSFRVIVGPRLPCATANQRAPEHQIELKACAPDETHLHVEWFTRRGTSEFRGSSALPIEPGSTVTLGSERDAFVEVVQG